MFKEQFLDVLAEFGRMMGVALDCDVGPAVFTVDDDIIVNIAYLDESDMVLAWSPVGTLDDPTGEKSMALLRLTDLDGVSEGWTLAVDAQADLVLAIDTRSALLISSPDALASWSESLVRCVRAVRENFEKNFPAEEEGEA